MKKIAIIIGFQYHDDIATLEDVYYRCPLPGIVIDMYLALKQVKNVEFDKIIVITDVYKDKDTLIVNEALTKNIVAIDILELIQNLKLNDEYLYFNNKRLILSTIKHLAAEADNLFIYYTGHASKGNLLLPRYGPQITIVGENNISSYEDDIININELKLTVLSIAKEELEAIFIMDCCNGNGLNLPFILKENIYKLHDHSQIEGEWLFHNQRFLCLSSSMNDEDAVAGREGSTFSIQLFKLLKECSSDDPNFKAKKRILNYIMKTIQNTCLNQYDQTATIHASHPDINIIWPWLITKNKKEIKLDINNYQIIIYSS